MKTGNLVFVAVFGLVITAAAFAGSESGGGGARLESAFRLQGMELISTVEMSPAASQYCSAEIMRNGLEGTRIRIVDMLTNPHTGKPISRQHLDAWTVPGDMQLKRKSWARFLDDNGVVDGRSIDTLILHEIYRSTGICDDENFKISDKVLRLIKLSNKYSKTYRFAYFGSFGDQYTVWPVCDATPTSGDYINTNCLYFRNNHVQIAATRAKLENNQIRVDPNNIRVLSQFTFYDKVDTIRFEHYENMLRHASPEIPFYVVIDLQTGAGSYGSDPTNLTSF